MPAPAITRLWTAALLAAEAEPRIRAVRFVSPRE